MNYIELQPFDLLVLLVIAGCWLYVKLTPDE